MKTSFDRILKNHSLCRECDTGLFEEREDHWKTAEEQHRAKMQECLDIRSLFVEMAATSLSARFYRILVSVSFTQGS